MMATRKPVRQLVDGKGPEYYGGRRVKVSQEWQLSVCYCAVVLCYIPLLPLSCCRLGCARSRAHAHAHAHTHTYARTSALVDHRPDCHRGPSVRHLTDTGVVGESAGGFQANCPRRVARRGTREGNAKTNDDVGGRRRRVDARAYGSRAYRV